MAKQGLNWFRIDVDFDDKIELVCAEYGSVAFEVIVRLWQKIYKEGYYCEWNTEVALLFAKKLGLGGNVVSEIVDCCIRRNVFSEMLYKEYGILTSTGIQQWYIDSTAKRVKVEVIKEYLTINADCLGQNVVIIDKNVGRNAKNDGRNQHSTDSTYITDSKDSMDSAPEGTPRTTALVKFIKPNLEEVKAYCEERKNTVDAQRWIDYYSSNGWRVGRNAMKDWRAAVRTWESNKGNDALYATRANIGGKTVAHAHFAQERDYSKEDMKAILSRDISEFE